MLFAPISYIYNNAPDLFNFIQYKGMARYHFFYFFKDENWVNTYKNEPSVYVISSEGHMYLIQYKDDKFHLVEHQDETLIKECLPIGWEVISQRQKDLVKNYRKLGRLYGFTPPLCKFEVNSAKPYSYGGY